MTDRQDTSHKHSWEEVGVGVTDLKRIRPSMVAYDRYYTVLRCKCGREKRHYHKEPTEFNT